MLQPKRATNVTLYRFTAVMGHWDSEINIKGTPNSADGILGLRISEAASISAVQSHSLPCLCRPARTNNKSPLISHATLTFFRQAC